MSFLPGMFPGGAPSAHLTTITQVLSTTSTTANVVAPAGIRAGDVIFILDFATNTSGVPTANVPTGFTGIIGLSSVDVGNRRLALYAKIADGAEGGTTLTGMSGTSANSKVLAVFRGNARISAMTPSTFNAQATTANPSAQNVTSGSGTTPLIVLGCYGASAAIDPRTFTPAKDGELNATTLSYLAWKIYNSGVTPADVSVDMDDEGNNWMFSGYVQFS